MTFSRSKTMSGPDPDPDPFPTNLCPDRPNRGKKKKKKKKNTRHQKNAQNPVPSIHLTHPNMQNPPSSLLPQTVTKSLVLYSLARSLPSLLPLGERLLLLLLLLLPRRDEPQPRLLVLGPLPRVDAHAGHGPDDADEDPQLVQGLAVLLLLSLGGQERRRRLEPEVLVDPVEDPEICLVAVVHNLVSEECFGGMRGKAKEKKTYQASAISSRNWRNFLAKAPSLRSLDSRSHRACIHSIWSAMPRISFSCRRSAESAARMTASWSFWSTTSMTTSPYRKVAMAACLMGPDAAGAAEPGFSAFLAWIQASASCAPFFSRSQSYCSFSADAWYVARSFRARSSLSRSSWHRGFA
ncbi:hypothetical protein F4802DRAFT_245858 [Xylaria palmicola]|nr:hypothetical protein F4802DRAFT_245858 [Xylaria palmicola]